MLLFSALIRIERGCGCFHEHDHGFCISKVSLSSNCAGHVDYSSASNCSRADLKDAIAAAKASGLVVNACQRATQRAVTAAGGQEPEVVLPLRVRPRCKCVRRWTRRR